MIAFMLLQPTIPHLTRSSLHRCLQAPWDLPPAGGRRRQASPKRKFKAYPIGYFHIDIAEVRTAAGQALSLRRHRPDLEIRLCRAA